MKRLLFLLSFILFFLVPDGVFAITPIPTQTSPTVAPTHGPTQAEKEQSLSQQIEKIKEKIAANVSKLHLVDNRGIIGTVAESTTTALSVNDIHGNIRFIDVDQLTKFASPSARNSSFGISDLTKGTTLSAIGKYNKDTKRLLARFITVITMPLYISGVITNIDRVNFTVSITTEKIGTQLIDIDSVTRMYSYDSTATETRSGFSKVELGERVFIVGYPNIKQKNRLSATRILLFPLLPANPHIRATIPITPTAAVLTPTLGPVKKQPTSIR